MGNRTACLRWVKRLLRILSQEGLIPRIKHMSLCRVIRDTETFEETAWRHSPTVSSPRDSASMFRHIMLIHNIADKCLIILPDSLRGGEYMSVTGKGRFG